MSGWATRAVMTAAAAVFSMNCARAQSTTVLPPEFQKAYQSWSSCLGDYIINNFSKTDKPENITDQALNLCGEQERTVASISAKYAETRGLDMAGHRAKMRAEAIALIMQSRAGVKPDDPLTIWSLCLGEATGKAIKLGQNSPAAIADEAFSQCQYLEAAARTSKQFASGSSAQDAKIFSNARQMIRDRLIEVATARQVKP